jgi:AraC-like DNA-binding protein
MSLSVRPDLFRPPRVTTEAPALDPRLAEALHRLVEVGVYKEEGLTIGGLAERMAVHEYRVRQLINDQLGFRNFNAFLNHYRVREAQRLLADPETRHRNVAEVAYEVGYRSLAPFNRAFKDTTGQTPTEFRSARLA